MVWNEICSIEMVCTGLKWIEMKSAHTLTNSFILGLFGLVWNGIEMVWNGFKWNLHIVLQILSFWAYLVWIEMKFKWIEMNLNLICILRSKYSSSKEFIKETNPQGRRVGFRVKFLYVNHLKFISNRFKSFQTVMLLKESPSWYLGWLGI